jgi:hypothetical protein
VKVFVKKAARARSRLYSETLVVQPQCQIAARSENAKNAQKRVIYWLKFNLKARIYVLRAGAQ